MAATPFDLAVQKWVETQKGNVDQITRSVVFQLAERIVDYSPVGDPALWKHPAPPGYTGGFFRANWTVSSEVSDDSGTVAVGAAPGLEEDPTGEIALAEIRRGLEAGKYRRQWVIRNRAPYAWALEYGHSTQAPHGMVRRTAMEFTTTVFAVVANIKQGGRFD